MSRFTIFGSKVPMVRCTLRRINQEGPSGSKQGIIYCSIIESDLIVQRSCHLEPAVPRPRLYAGADQPARLSLEIDAIEAQGEKITIVSKDVLQSPFFLRFRNSSARTGSACRRSW